ncbi:hypothetical protein I6J18_00045 (plasmid) [Peribacillus psychrosaccharolyticus]|uniref:HTH cro/C1-type domain-containing protein n=1 Tax=Peribacillus psychrosaccharolyticus TaxID=1407 RepID=A0A974RYH7_PERPY|nr:hypothetical protein [Peribacillus psychrosaccharolyticus]MEC2054206.1 hypothetical protein [Peribacillus psychrosaccharolyticus]MED3746557.1 hypothetical protein [Peribacillus psychrosaccharolyticus]QQS98435.1 hypothetical protein I6J18_00045 [Peribacillus psychrosaccharolyticus]
MDYLHIPDTMLLNYEWLKVAIFEENKHLFEDRPYIIEKWKQNALLMTGEEQKTQYPTATMSPSFRALYSLFTETLFIKQPINKQMIKDAVKNYESTIRIILSSHFFKEFPDNEIKHSMNEEKIDTALQQDFIYASMDKDFHLMRDIVTKKKVFKESEAGNLSTEIIDNRGRVRGLAELRPSELHVVETDQQNLWLELIESTLNSLDEMTADLFDLITYLWMVSPKSPDGFIEFHSNDALRLRNMKKRSVHGRELDFREEDRFNIMKRVAALSSIWVSLGDQQVKVVDAIDLQDNDLYAFKDFQRMFEIGKMRIAYDKKSGEPKGIYAVQVKPSPILTPYLDGSHRSLGILDLQVFQYNHFTQREHKRLTRYLNVQWKIRTIKNNLQQPFKVSTLLKVMDFSARYNGIQVRDKFESVLDQLQADSVIKSWHYNEVIDEERVGKKGWFTNYWVKINVTVLPTEGVVKENQKKITPDPKTLLNEKILVHMNHVQTQPIPNTEQTMLNHTDGIYNELAATIDQLIPETSNSIQQAFDFTQQTEVVLSPETMKKTMDDLNMSIRKTAEEIGIAHTTLSRYLKKENKRQNNKNDIKMQNWLNEQIVTKG